MGRRIVRFNGLKSSRADVQSHRSSFDADCLEFGQEFRGEMQSGGWRGNRSGRLRINRLIALAVFGRAEGIVPGVSQFAALAPSEDIGRQGNTANLRQDLEP